MKIIDHHGRFMRAEDVKARVVAIVWSKLKGGEIVGALDLGEHRTTEGVLSAIRANGLTARSAVIAGMSPSSYSFDGESVTPDAIINVCK